MSECAFRILVGRHPADGVRLALRLCGEEGGREAILIPVGGESCSLQFGFAVPPDYPGVAGLLRYKRDSLLTDVEWAGGRGRVVFPSPATHDAPMGEVLDRLRERLGDEPRATVFLLLDRLAGDLPPLREGDSMMLFWEARDALGVEALDHIRGLVEAVEGGPARFEGIRLYHRREPGAQAEARAQAIEDAVGPFSGPVVKLV